MLEPLRPHVVHRSRLQWRSLENFRKSTASQFDQKHQSRVFISFVQPMKHTRKKSLRVHFPAGRRDRQLRRMMEGSQQMTKFSIQIYKKKSICTGIMPVTFRSHCTYCIFLAHISFSRFICVLSLKHNTAFFF